LPESSLRSLGDFDDRHALIGESRNREQRTHEDELSIRFKEGDGLLGEIWNQLDWNAALTSSEA
jgi:hypothetical protein